MPPQYVIMRQPSGHPCEVVFYDSDKQTRTVLFSGGRWKARHFIAKWHNENPTIPCFNEHKGRNGHPGSTDELFTNEKQ